MMKLSTKFIGPISTGLAVAWRTGTKNKGIISVQGILFDSDVGAAAELIVIRHLLFSKNVLNRDIINGSGIALEISSPIVKNLYRRKTTRKHLKPFMHFLQTTLTGVTINISSEIDTLLPVMSDNLTLEYINSADTPSYDVIRTISIGDIRITKHAIEQYEERTHSGDLSKPLASLVRRLKHPDLSLQRLPDHTIKHKLRKYGSIDNLEVWGHDTSQMHYVIVRDCKNIGTLVTVYKRHPSYTF